MDRVPHLAAEARRRVLAALRTMPAVTALCLNAGCSDAKSSRPESEYKSTRTESMMGITAPAATFFPRDESGENGLGSHSFKWHLDTAESMGLSSLAALAGKDKIEIYRFMMRPTWLGPYEMTLKIDPAFAGIDVVEPWRPEAGVGGEANEKARAAWSVWSSRPVGTLSWTLFNPGSTVTPWSAEASGTTVVRQRDWSEFRQLVETAGLSHERTEDLYHGVRDGSSWAIEWLRSGRYHMVERNTPTLPGEGDPRGTAGFVAVAEWLKDHAVPPQMGPRI